MKESTWHNCYDDTLKSLITPESFAHPAKMAKKLCERIFEYGEAQGYWSPGAVILDPFGGVGTTGLIGAYRGYRVVSIELETRFYRMATKYDCPGVSKETWLRYQGQLNRVAWLCPHCQSGKHLEYHGFGVIPHTESHLYVGNIEKNRKKLLAHGCPLPVMIQGDSRNARALLAQAAGAITSPPYAENVKHDYTHEQRDERRLGKGFTGRGRGSFRGSENYGEAEGQIGRMNEGDFAQAAGAITSPPYADSVHDGNGIDPEKLTGNKAGKNSQAFADGYGSAAGQIGALKEGDFAGAITSPPYSEGLGHGGEPQDIGNGGQDGLNAMIGGYGSAAGQIGALKEGDFAGAITSPPWEDTLSNDRVDPAERVKLARELGISNAEHITAIDMAKIGKRSYGYVDGSVTSPPYEAAQSGGGIAVNGYHNEAMRSGVFDLVGKRSYMPATHGETDGQIGNETGETYWQAMRQVYAEMLAVLVPGGVAAVVVKDFVRNKERVPLCDMTAQLLEAVGFTVIERTKVMMVKEQHLGVDMFSNEHVTKKKSKKSFFRRLAESKGSPEINWEEVIWAQTPGGSNAPSL